MKQEDALRNLCHKIEKEIFREEPSGHISERAVSWLFNLVEERIKEADRSRELRKNAGKIIFIGPGTFEVEGEPITVLPDEAIQIRDGNVEIVRIQKDE